MAGSLERKADGSIALFIRGDLQFDSADEHIYHEALVLPAVALAAKRIETPLKVLVIGGGDGLVARELFKSPRIASVDLVDYDPEVLRFAQGDLAALNNGSLCDSRMAIHVQDAWGFVDSALAVNVAYDVVISDLTVPDDLSSTRFHSLDWYAKLSRLLSPRGVLAVNAVSPEATSRAYWSIFNGMIKGGLDAKPYHIHIPSFAAQGFGQDWGFFIASNEPLIAEEFKDSLELAEPRQFLRNAEHLISLFEFPTEFFEYQENSLPAAVGSDILLRYFGDAKKPIGISGLTRSAFTLSTSSLYVPEADTGKTILPEEISSLVGKAIHTESEIASSQSGNSQLFLYGVLDLMPSLNREHTKEVIDDFLADPESFLQAIDIPGLVKRLLNRAAELPAKIVTELEVLRDSLAGWSGDLEGLLNFGHRVVTILMLVLVVGNLLYPDMVYGKGEAAHSAAAHDAGHARGGRGAGRGGYGYDGNGYWYNGTWVRRPVNVQKQIITPKTRVAPRGAGPGGPQGSLPVPNHLGFAQYTDISGRVYPSRRYRFDIAAADQVVDCYASYRLGQGADILPVGHIAMPLTEQSYLLVTKDATHVVDQESGKPMISLSSDATLIAFLVEEVNWQSEQTQNKSLAAAKDLFAQLPASVEKQPTSLAQDGVEVFPGAWITNDGKYLALRRQGDRITYLDSRGWYSDRNGTALSEPYPDKLKATVSSYLAQFVRNVESTGNRLRHDKTELATYLDVLQKELDTYRSSVDEDVAFGSRQIPRTEAIRLTQSNISKVERKMLMLDQYSLHLPGQIELAKIALVSLTSSGIEKS